MKQSKPAIDQLYTLMQDQAAKMRVRITSAIAASRVEPLTMPGEEPTPAVAFLRNIITFQHNGRSYTDEWKTEAARALAYYERRAKKAELQYQVTNPDERITQWRRILNSLLRQHLWATGRWPQDSAALFSTTDTFTIPPHDPELALAALLTPADQHQRRQRQKAIDQPIAAHIASEEQRHEILRSIAAVMQKRLAEWPQDEGFVMPLQSG